MLADQAVYKKKAYDIGMLDEVLEYAKLKNFLEYPAIAMYYYSYMTMTDRENESHFQNLKNEIARNGYLFPKTELRDILLSATNYCIGRMNAGYTQYIRESFELFHWGLNENVLLDEGILSRITFMNIVTIGNMLGEYDWIEKFIHDYKGFLEDQYRDDLVHYSLARLHFEKGDYKTAMQLFRQVEYDDILMNLNAKLMQFKMFYEQGDLEVVESLLESMRTYLARKEVIGYHKANYKNIIRLTKKMLKINPYNQAQKTKLLKEIEEANPLAERKWLLKQLKQL
jgi:tetratricopeptide (TPR) repeat protein